MALVFIGGTSQSGMDVMQRILCLGDGVGPEIGGSPFIRRFMEAYLEGMETFDEKGKAFFPDKMALLQYTKRLILEFLDSTRKLHANPEHLIFADPHLTGFFPAVHGFLPEAKFVILVRDPRDTVASFIAERRRTALSLGNDAEVLTEYAQSFSKNLSASIAHQSRSFRKQTLFVRFEDLHSEPAEMLKILQDFTEIDLRRVNASQSLLNTNKQAEQLSLFDSEEQSVGHDNLIGQYLNVLNLHEVKHVEYICRSIFDVFKYRLSGGEMGKA